MSGVAPAFDPHQGGAAAAVDAELPIAPFGQGPDARPRAGESDATKPPLIVTAINRKKYTAQTALCQIERGRWPGLPAGPARWGKVQAGPHKYTAQALVAGLMEVGALFIGD